MIYFILPKSHINIYKEIQYNVVDLNTPTLISHSLYYYLLELKQQIHEYGNDWSHFKKYTNPYEYIHTYIPNKNKCVSKYKPISRAYFKMIEIINTFQLLNSGDMPSISYNGTYPVGIRYGGGSGGGGGGGGGVNNLRERESTQKIECKNEKIIQEEMCQSTPMPEECENECYIDLKQTSTRGNGSFQEFQKKQHNINFQLQNQQAPIKTFHLAEGPGGFIEAFVNLRKSSVSHDVYSKDIYTGITIIDDCRDYNIPGWKKTKDFLRENSTVKLEYAKDGTGNLLNIGNFEYCVKKYGSTMDFITGDGGFDFSTDPNHQEETMTNLLFAQVCYALTMQKYGGAFILKIFDCFTASTVDIIYILSAFYEKVYIAKPFTSRYANSEKYIICKNFLFKDSTKFYGYLHKTLSDLLANNNENDENDDNNDNTAIIDNLKILHSHNSQHVWKTIRFLNISISNYFITKLEEYNSIFGQQQLENIYKTIVLIIQNKYIPRIGYNYYSNKSQQSQPQHNNFVENMPISTSKWRIQKTNNNNTTTTTTTTTTTSLSTNTNNIYVAGVSAGAVDKSYTNTNSSFSPETQQKNVSTPTDVQIGVCDVDVLRTSQSEGSKTDKNRIYDAGATRFSEEKRFLNESHNIADNEGQKVENNNANYTTPNKYFKVNKTGANNYNKNPSSSSSSSPPYPPLLYSQTTDDNSITINVDKLLKINIQKCIQWCIKNGVPFISPY